MVLALDATTPCPWDSKARVQAVPEVSCLPPTWLPGGSLLGVREGTRFPAGSCQARQDVPLAQQNRRTSDHDPGPTASQPNPAPPSLPSLQAQGGCSWVQPPQSGQSGRREESRESRAALPRSSSSFRSTNISLSGGSEGPGLGRRPGGCWTRPGRRGHPASPRQGRCPVGSRPHQVDWTESKAPCPVLCTLECVPRSPRRKWPLLLGQTFSLSPQLPQHLWGSVSEIQRFRQRPQAWAGQGRRGGLPALLAWGAVLAPGGPLPPCSSQVRLGAIFGRGESRMTHGRASPGEGRSCSAGKAALSCSRPAPGPSPWRALDKKRLTELRWGGCLSGLQRPWGRGSGDLRRCQSFPETDYCSPCPDTRLSRFRGICSDPLNYPKLGGGGRGGNISLLQCYSLLAEFNIW